MYGGSSSIEPSWSATIEAEQGQQHTGGFSPASTANQLRIGRSDVHEEYALDVAVERSLQDAAALGAPYRQNLPRSQLPKSLARDAAYERKASAGRWGYDSNE